MAGPIGKEELRALIREALKDALGAEASPSPLRGRDREGGKGAFPSPTPNPSTQGNDEKRARHGSLTISTGVLTETKVREAARQHAVIQVGTEVAITPLARDKARELKVQIERLKP